MKKMMTLIVAALVLMTVSSSAMAQFCYRPAPRYGYPMHPPVRFGVGVSFGSPCAYGYAQPVYHYQPAPYVYAQPAPVIMQQAPVYQQPAPVYSAPAPAAAPRPTVVTLQFPPGFQEKKRRYHGSGDDAGQIDWVKGTLNGKSVKIEFNADGTVHDTDD